MPTSTPEFASAATRNAGAGLTLLTPPSEEELPASNGSTSCADLPSAAAQNRAETRPNSHGLLASWPFAVPVAIALGLVIAYYIRRPAEETWHPSVVVLAPSKPAGNWIEVSSSGKHFPRLQDAIGAAGDGDILLIHGDGPFCVPPVRIQGKALAIKAAPGSQPRLELPVTSRNSAWQALLSTDRPLTLQGLELTVDHDQASAAAEPMHLVYCEGGALHMRDCRLLANGIGHPVGLRSARRIVL